MLQVALSTYVFAFYERLFVNFILAKKIFVKVFRIKPRKKHISKSAMQEQTEISNLVNTIKEDNNKFEAKTEFEKEQEKTQENGPQIDLNDPQIISMPHLDEEK